LQKTLNKLESKRSELEKTMMDLANNENHNDHHEEKIQELNLIIGSKDSEVNF